MNFIPLNGWPQLKDIPEKLEHFREVYARFAKVNRWYKSIKETEQTGNPVIFNSALKLNATALNVGLLPIQSGTGDPSPENVRPISGRTSVNVGRTGKNVLYCTLARLKALNTNGTWNNNVYTESGVTITVLTNNSDYVTQITVNTPASASALVAFRLSNDFSGVNGTTYTLNGCPSGGGNSTYRVDTFVAGESPNAIDTGSGASFTATSSTQTVRLVVFSGTTISNKIFYPMIRLATASDPTFEPYTPVTLTIALGTTVYGGTLDVKTGEVDSTYGMTDENDFTGVSSAISAGGLHWIDIDGLSKINGDGLSNMLENKSATAWASTTPCLQIGTTDSKIRIYGTFTTLEEFRTQYAGLQICYELATPTTVQLTGAELEMLKGYNLISTDADSLTVKAYTI